MVDATVSYLDFGTLRFDRNFALAHDTVATADDPDPALDRVAVPVYGLVVDHPEATLLVDTGSHPEAAAGHWPAELYDTFEHVDAAERTLTVALDDAGYDLADVDAVLQTHLHIDHAGGLHRFDGTDVPVYVHERELKHAYYVAATGDGSGYLRGDFDHDLNWQPVGGDESHLTDCEFLHLPGHTPGLLGLRLDRAEGTVLFLGDHADLRANYEAGEPTGAGFCWSSRDWRESLRRVRDLARRTDATVLCGHDPEDAERLRGGLG